jgi:transposase InsO family protein
MSPQDLIDRTLLYHLWHKHPDTNPPTKLRNDVVVCCSSSQIKIAVSITDWYDWSVRQFAATVKRSIGWVCTWLTRFRTELASPTLLLDRAHVRPDAHPHTTRQVVMETILDLRDHPPESLRRVPGPKAILYYLERAQHLADQALPRSTRTIWRILQAAGRIITTVRTHQERLERPDPMVEWQMDLKDVTTVPADPDGKRRHVVECLNLIDVGSDVLLGAIVRGDFTAATVIPSVIAVLETRGLPEALRFDRDTRFVGRAGQGDFPSALVKTLLCLHIQPIICDPHRPDQNGVVERYHRTYGEECLAVDQPRTEAEARLATDANQARYNHERPNQSVVCGNQPPCVAHPDLPRRRSLPELVDPDAWLAAIDGLRYRRKVQADTSITIAHHRYYTRADLVGKDVTVRVDAGAQELVIEDAGRAVRRVPVQGLHQTGPIPLDQFLALRVQEAAHEQPVRRGRKGAATTRGGKANRWIDRVNQAHQRSQEGPAAETPASGAATEAAGVPDEDTGIPF